MNPHFKLTFAVFLGFFMLLTLSLRAGENDASINRQTLQADLDAFLKNKEKNKEKICFGYWYFPTYQRILEGGLRDHLY